MGSLTKYVEPNNFKTARQLLSNDNERLVYDSLFVDLSQRGLAETTDCYMLATYCQLTLQIQGLLNNYNPAEPIIEELKIDKEGNARTVTKVNPTHKVYIDLLKKQSELAEALGLQVSSRGKLLVRLQKAEALRISLDFAEQRLELAKVEAKERVRLQEMRHRESVVRLELVEERMRISEKLSRERLDMDKNNTRTKDSMRQKNVGLTEELRMLQKEAASLRKQAAENKDKLEAERLQLAKEQNDKRIELEKQRVALIEKKIEEQRKDREERKKEREARRKEREAPPASNVNSPVRQLMQTASGRKKKKLQLRKKP